MATLAQADTRGFSFWQKMTLGLALFIVADIAKSPLATVAKGTIPYIIGFLVVLMLVTFIPQISLWLPNLVYGAAQ